HGRRDRPEVAQRTEGWISHDGPPDPVVDVRERDGLYFALAPGSEPERPAGKKSAKFSFRPSMKTSYFSLLGRPSKLVARSTPAPPVVMESKTRPMTVIRPIFFWPSGVT